MKMRDLLKLAPVAVLMGIVGCEEPAATTPPPSAPASAPAEGAAKEAPKDAAPEAKAEEAKPAEAEAK